MNNVVNPIKKRIESLINPNADPLGAGWNVTQSKIAMVQVALEVKVIWKDLRQASISFLFKVLTLFFQ